MSLRKKLIAALPRDPFTWRDRNRGPLHCYSCNRPNTMGHMNTCAWMIAWRDTRALRGEP